MRSTAQTWEIIEKGNCMELHKEITEGLQGGNSLSIAGHFVLIFKCIHLWPVYMMP